MFLIHGYNVQCDAMMKVNFFLKFFFFSFFSPVFLWCRISVFRLCVFFFSFDVRLLFFSYSDESPLIPNEFLQEPHVTAQDLGGETILGLMLESEPDLWIRAVPAHVKCSLKEKQVYPKRIQCQFA